ncbi:MAG: hypothetical protein M3296_01995 [Actinomycetota bacterium]|nr:hypothetical protein [Actinomycetota bacterium]
MAQTKKKRRTKHRGDATGKVVARGRTGRRPTEEERKPTAAQRRQERMYRPPTWRGAAQRSAVAALIFGVLVVVVFKQTIAQGIALTGFVFLLYIPLGYYTDAFLHRRKGKGKGKAAASPPAPEKRKS